MAQDENGEKAIVGKTLGYWLCDEDFISTLELKALNLGRIGFPRDWPAVYTSNKALKLLIGKKGLCAGKKVGVVGLHSDEERALLKGLTLYPLQSFANSERVLQASGLPIVKGWVVYEHLDRDVGEGFVAERYWWNALPDGKWVDFTPRPEAWPELLLAEAAGDSSKAKTALRTEEASIVLHLLTERGFPAPSAKVEGATPRVAPTPAAPSSSSTEPVVPPASSKPTSAVAKAIAGDAAAMKELEERAKAEEAFAVQLAGQKELLVALGSMLKQDSKKEAALQLLLAISDAAVEQKNMNAKEAIVEAQVVTQVAALLKDASVSLQEMTCALLGNLSHESPANQDAIAVATNVVKNIVGLLSSSHAAVSQEAAYAVWNLTVGHEQNAVVVVDAGGIPKLAELLKSTSDVAQENAAGALMHVTVSASARKAILDAGALERLCQLLAPEFEPEVSCQAAGALLNMASDCPESVGVMVKHGAVGPLIRLLKEGLDLTKEYAAGALMNIMRVDTQVADKAIKSDAIPVLAGLLQKGIGSSEALGALANLACESPERQIAIYKAQVTRKSVASLRDPNVEVRKGAVALIMNLAPHAKIKERIVEAEVFKPLAACLEDSEQAVRERAAGALANLFNDHSANVHAAFEQAPNMVAPLVQLLSRSGSSEEAKRQAAHAIAMLAAEDGSCDAVWKQNPGKPLLQLLQQHVGEAALAIMNLAWRWLEVKKEFVDGGALDHLVAMVKSGDVLVMEYATGALMNMTAGAEENAKQVVSIVPDVASILKFKSTQAQEWAAGALANIVRSGDGAQEAAFAAGAAESLAALLPKATPNGKTLVVLALTALAEKNADAIRKVLGTKEKAKLRDFRDSGMEELGTLTQTLVETIGGGFAL